MSAWRSGRRRGGRSWKVRWLNVVTQKDVEEDEDEEGVIKEEELRGCRIGGERGARGTRRRRKEEEMHV